MKKKVEEKKAFQEDILTLYPKRKTSNRIRLFPMKTDPRVWNKFFMTQEKSGNISVLA